MKRGPAYSVRKTWGGEGGHPGGSGEGRLLGEEGWALTVTQLIWAPRSRK